MPHRRQFLSAATFAAGAAAIGTSSRSVLGNEPATIGATESDSVAPVKFALNTSTIRGQKLSITQQIEVTSKAGYDGIEPWLRDIDRYVDEGGQLSDLRKRIEDAGLFVASAIGFANWIDDDESVRASGLETARRDMGRIAELGGQLIAAPPIGAHKSDSASPPLDTIAARYRELCKCGQAVGVRPQLELWGLSPTLHKLGELAYVAAEAAHPFACVLPDFYHIYKGGNDFASLAMIEASRMFCFHINDYPAMPPQPKIGDRDRIFPGDGICPLPQVIRSLVDAGF